MAQPNIKCIINGVETGRGDNSALSVVNYVRGSQTVLNALLLEETDLGMDLTSDTVTLNVYENYKKRTEAEGGPAAGTTTGILATVNAAASTSSVAVITILDTEAAFLALDILPRQNYYAEISIVDSSDSSKIKHTRGFEFKVS